MEAHRLERARLDVIRPPGHQRPEGQEDGGLPQACAHQLHRLGRIEIPRQQPQGSQESHPGTSQEDQGQTADAPHPQEEKSQEADGGRGQPALLDHPAAAAERGGVDVDGVAAEGIVIIIEKIGPGMQGGHPQEGEAQQRQAALTHLPVGQGPGYGHRHKGAGQKREPQGPQIDLPKNHDFSTDCRKYRSYYSNMSTPGREFLIAGCGEKR